MNAGETGVKFGHDRHGHDSSRSFGLMATLLCQLDRASQLDTDVIPWGSPVLSFGDPSNAMLATVGLNPSNKEFVDNLGSELAGASRRFHTLASLGLDSWLEADARHMRFILESCCNYFTINPYNTWFKRLDWVASGLNATFYGHAANACHLDLIPFATAQKWTELTSSQRQMLLELAQESLSILLGDSPIRVIILNGKSVVDQFEIVAGIRLEREVIEGATLRRRNGSDITGYGYRGSVNSLSGNALQHEILVYGYNHNLQSSYGITRGVIEAVRRWVSADLEFEKT